MANRRLANSITNQLKKLDDRIEKELCKSNPFSNTDALDAKKIELIKSAKKRGLKFVAVSVADGTAVYWETNRTTKLVTFEWLYGGGDDYVSDFGKIIIVPIPQANKMIRNFKTDWVA